MDGLIVLQPFANQIINCTKKTEFRNKKPPIDKIKVPLYLLNSGYVLGKFMIVGIKKGKPGFRFGWSLKVLNKFKNPKRYRHPMGAQI